jgi:hypothetical protein
VEDGSPKCGAAFVTVAERKTVNMRNLLKLSKR